MAYKKGIDIFPAALLEEIQKYVSGEMVYIPQKESVRKSWGSCSGAKVALEQRNNAIKRQFQEGAKPSDLADRYYLSVDTIKKIVY